MTERICPGCGMRMPLSERVYDDKFNASAECWSVFTEVIGAEFSNAVLFGQVHQLTVDAYAVQHAGGRHPDKSVDIHLAGLYLVLERGLAPTSVPPQLQRLAVLKTWPHFERPAEFIPQTVLYVPLADSHADAVRAWAKAVWQTWSPHHAAVAELVARYCDLPEGTKYEV
jgi:hypothetical protein